MNSKPEPHHDWLVATVADRWAESGEAIGLRLQVEHKPPHLAGQHLDLRLRAEDGYEAVRAYSIATPDDGSHFLVLGIQVLSDGEVSAYLGSYAAPGTQLEVKLAGSHYFTWKPADPTPTLLIGGGSGIVPLVSMWRAHALAGSKAPMAVLYSARQPESLMYAAEWAGQAHAYISYTNTPPPGWNGYHRIIDRQMIDDVVGDSQQFYLCGPTPFVETASSLLSEMGFSPDSIKTERFGPTGQSKSIAK